MFKCLKHCIPGENQNQSNAPLDIDTIRETNSMSNSITSFASGYTQTTIRNRRRGVIEDDPNAEILRATIRVASCAIIVLEEVSNITLLNFKILKKFKKNYSKTKT